MKFLFVLCVFCASVISAIAMDREAFTFTKYDLQVRVEPEQQRLAVRGRISLRNDSALPQKSITLQISSTLDWRSIQIAGKPVEFSSHVYASDIDHTGALSEAIVGLPQEVAPRGTLDVEIGYEGVVPLDATRLVRIGAPEEKAKHIDWDQISKSFSAVRGIGYVAWYPVATEGASLSDGDSVQETIGRWTAKHGDSEMNLLFESTSSQAIWFSGTKSLAFVHRDEGILNIAEFSVVRPGVDVPTFVLADYQKLTPKDLLSVLYLPGQDDAAKSYGEVAAQTEIAITPVGRGSENLQILALPDSDASSFVTAGMLLTPFKLSMTNETELSIVYAKARHMVLSPRAWIQEGLAHYTQAAFVETQQGRQAALDYLTAHVSALVEAEKPAGNSAREMQAAHSLINGPTDLHLQTKAMYVWWMLKDMLGHLPIEALLDYHGNEDKDAAYMQRLIQAHSHRDLEWFFDDWVYRDRGLPDFRVVSVYPREIVNGGYMITVEVENLGNAGAEVPIILRNSGDADITKRLEVHAKSKASIRIESPSIPKEVVVNDGSVPESDMSNNSYKLGGR